MDKVVTTDALTAEVVTDVTFSISEVKVAILFIGTGFGPANKCDI